MQFMLHVTGVKLTQGDLMGMPWRRACILSNMIQEFTGNITEDDAKKGGDDA